MANQQQVGGVVRTAPISVRVRPELKLAIERAAAESGRSQTAIVEDWIDAAQGLSEPQVAMTLFAMAKAAHRVERELGDPTQNALAREAMMAAWQAIMDTALPIVPVTHWEDRVLDLREDARSALRQALERLRDNEFAEKFVPPATPRTGRPAGLFGGGGGGTGGLPDTWLWMAAGSGLLAQIKYYVFGDGLLATSHDGMIRTLRAWESEASHAVSGKAGEGGASDAVSEVEHARKVLEAYEAAVQASADEQASAIRVGRAIGLGGAELRKSLRYYAEALARRPAEA